MRVLLLVSVALVAILTGCSTGYSTITPRSAVEMALMSEAAERTIAQLELPPMAATYKKFHLDDSGFEGTDSKFMLSELRRHLLTGNAMGERPKDDADLVVYPRAAIAAMDESKLLIGIPEFPVPLGATTLTTPEIALFKRHIQRGRTKLGMFATNTDDGLLAFDAGIKSGNTFYTRWTVLILFTFATTDLTEPYKTAKVAAE